MINMKYLFLIVFISYIKVSFAQCPSDWIQFNQKCYFFSNTGSNPPLSWHEAVSRCESFRGNLVVVETAEEHNFLYEQLPEVSYFYIGLHDLNGENAWQWVNGQNLDGFVLWAEGQPDNWQSAVGSQEDCVEMVQDQGGAWNDLACSLRHDYICERDLNIDPLPNCQEELGWKEFGGRCYKVVTNKLAWAGAEADCMSMGAHLVGIGTEQEQLFVANEVNTLNEHMWIGLSSVDDRNENLHWSNGVDEYPGYSNWGAGQPALNSSKTNCVGIDPSIASNGPWGVERCGEAHSYMCETGITGSCAPGWFLYKGTCYFQASTEQLWKSWVVAKAYCDLVGASLVKIDSMDKQDYVNSRLPDIANGGSLNVWIGASDSEADGSFVWTDGSSATTAPFTYWQPTQPVNREKAWDCAQIFTGSSWGGWEVDDCYKKQAFMCEIPPGVDVKPDNPVGPGSTGCDPGWLFFQQHCYYFEYLKELTWQQAEDDCVRYGAHLTSILTGEENAFVTGHASGTTWIGGHDNQGEGRFEWSDRSPFGDFTNWAEGEPNNNEGTADCVQLWAEVGYQWDDNDCSKQSGYVCKALPHDCDQALGMESGRILDSDVTASSQWDENHAPYLARLNNHKSGDVVGAWIPTLQPDGNFAPAGTIWIQVRLSPTRTVSGITTQGRPADWDQYVTSYVIKYSNDGNTWMQIGETYTANTDTYTPVTNRLPYFIVTSYIRLYPMSWYGSPALRMEVLGCNSEGADLATPSPDGECTAVAVNERLDCGYPGIGGQECLNKGCCWDNTVHAVWCFYKKGDYDPRCGKDWSFDPGGQFQCYHFNDMKRRTWSQAREHCLAMGGDLLSINSQHEQAYVTSHLSSLVLTNSLWIGANQLDAEAGWRWSSGAAFNYVNWNTGEPNGHQEGEDCVEIYTSHGTWNDISCAHEAGIACKKVADIAPPVITDDGNVVINICEGETATLACAGNTVLAIHHAVYGRTDDFTCGEGNLVPEGGCVADDSMDILASMCNNKDSCDVSASNEVFGEPCHGTFKYLNVIYSCENKVCFNQLGVENGTVGDAQISGSSQLDTNHKPTDGRLNGPRGWATQEGIGSWVQITFPQKLRISGVITQGSKDAARYVTKFKIGIANDDTFQSWTDYTNIDNEVVMFEGNTDQETAKRSVFAEHVFTSGIRIYPREWEGDVLGMRFEVTGCNPLRELTCEEQGDIVSVVAEGEILQADCPGLCPFLVDSVDIYGTGIYAGSSQICNAAVHAGVIFDRFGGPVTMVRKPSQSTYQGSVKNTLVSKDLDYYPIAFSFTNNEKNCEAGWIPYFSHCYWMANYALTWAESEAACVQQDAHLVSVFDQVEQDFIIQMIHQYSFQNIWTGLNELRSTNTYEWSDGEPVLYTNWNPSEPNNWEGRSEECVAMYQSDADHMNPGRWNDDLCSNTYGFICKKLKSYYTESEAAHPTPAPGCKEGWLPYDYTCYLFHRHLMVEEEAETFCAEQGGQPVHVMNKYTQSFLHTVIGAEDFRWWLGLHAVVSGDTGVSWQWESGDPVTYDNWAAGNPTVNAGECVVFYGGAYGFGFWYSNRCDKQAYTICEAPREGFAPPPPTTPPPVGGCYHDWKTPNEADGFCYKVYSPSDEDQNNNKQAWNNAYHQCLAMNADLVSIHSKTEEEFLIQQIKDMGMTTDYLWIGLNNKGGGGWMWSDNSPVQYVNWNPGSPSSNIENNCVRMKYDSETGYGLWENADCQQHLDWICKIPKGIDVVEPTDPPTGVPDQSCGSSEDGLWMKFDEKCYLFDNSTTADVYTAERKCYATGGYLASIHSDKEQAFITNVLQSISSVSRFWIGLREQGGINGEYMWSDGTPIDFIYWDQGEPNDAGGQEQCVCMYKSDGRWNDANCGMKYAGFVCKKYPNGPPIDPSPTPPAEGGCEVGWYRYGNDCYRLMGDSSECTPEVTNNTDCTADFPTAQTKCTEMGANLVSIHNKYENAFIAAQSFRAINNLWIGLSAYHWNSKPYTWANGDEVTYTNWNEGEPNVADGAEHCVEIYRTEAITGRWNDNQCGVSVPYICSKRRDPKNPDGQEINNNLKCRQGWMQYDTVKDNYVCFYLDQTLRSFDDAQANCVAMGANLASLQTTWEQAFLTSYIQDNLAWIGMKLDQTSYEWNWIDGWPVWISNWGEAQPGSDYTRNCVLNKDSMLGSEWVTASCTEQHMSVCKMTTEHVPTTPAYQTGYCLDGSWEEYGGFCYFAYVLEGQAEDTEGLTWQEAELMCNSYRGNLASFTSREELEWALGWYNLSESLWIGLTDNGQGGWSWTDGRPVSFTYWGTGEPNNAGEEGEDCVEMTGSGKWNDLQCTNMKGYMCRVPKVIGTDENGDHIFYTTPTPQAIPSEVNGGIIAGAVIGALLALVLIVGIIVYCTRSSTNVSKLVEDASQLPSGFVNKLYDMTSSSTSPSSSEKKEPEMKFDKESGATFNAPDSVA